MKHLIRQLLILLVLFNLSFSLSVNDVTLLTNLDSTSLSGSIFGGTKLYISGLGFSPIMSDNKIMVGDYPCML